MSLPALDNLVRIGQLKAEPRNVLEVTRMLWGLLRGRYPLFLAGPLRRCAMSPQSFGDIGGNELVQADAFWAQTLVLWPADA